MFILKHTTCLDLKNIHVYTAKNTCLTLRPPRPLLLITEGNADVNIHVDGTTPLLEAQRRGHREIVKLLTYDVIIIGAPPGAPPPERRKGAPWRGESSTDSWGLGLGAFVRHTPSVCM